MKVFNFKASLNSRWNLGVDKSCTCVRDVQKIAFSILTYEKKEKKNKFVHEHWLSFVLYVKFIKNKSRTYPVALLRIESFIIGFLDSVQSKRMSLHCSQNKKFRSIILHRNRTQINNIKEKITWRRATYIDLTFQQVITIHHKKCDKERRLNTYYVWHFYYPSFEIQLSWIVLCYLSYPFKRPYTFFYKQSKI